MFDARINVVTGAVFAALMFAALLVAFPIAFRRPGTAWSWKSRLALTLIVIGLAVSIGFVVWMIREFI